jgi:hypothetical protein
MAQSAANDPSNPWLQEFADSLDANDAFGRGAQEYQFAENNPYLTHAEPYSVRSSQGPHHTGTPSYSHVHYAPSRHPASARKGRYPLPSALSKVRSQVT